MASIQQSIEVNVPAQTAYAALSNFSEYPRFMEGVDEIRQTDANHFHWRVSRGGRAMEWDSEIVERTPAQALAWRNSGAPTESGRIMLSPQDADRTRITLTMEFMPFREPSDGASHEEPEARMAAHAAQDLARFKAFVEAQGSVMQPAGQQETAAPAQAGGTDGTSGTGQASGYAAGSEGWDGNEDPGTPVISSSRHADGSQHASARAEVGSVGARAAKEGSAQASATAWGGSGPAAGDERDATTPHRSRTESRSGAGAGQDGREASSQSSSWMPDFLRAWEEPIVAMRRMSDEMDQMFRKFVGGPLAAAKARAGSAVGAAGAGGGDWSPQIEVAQRDNQLLVSADIPGVRRENVQIEIQGDRLIIEGERFDESAGADDSPAGQGSAYRHTERSYGHFYRAIVLPSGADGDAASASMQDGILRVVVPIHAPPRRSRKVDIRP